MPSDESSGASGKAPRSLPLWAVFLLLAVILVVGLFFILPTEERAYTRWADLRECPHNPRFTEVGVPADSAERVMSVIQKQITEATGGTHDVSEYNDCQRFLAPGSRLQPIYDSLFSIFAVKLDSLETRLRRNPLPSGVGVAAGIIWAEGDYPPLNIEAGFNCLLMAIVPPKTGQQWVASVVKSRREADCTGTFDMERILPVRRTSPMPVGKGHYPPIVRWGFDAATWQQFVAITCGQGTCYVGQRRTLDLAGTALPETPSMRAAAGTYFGTPYSRVQRVHRVAVWHDQQFLATLPASHTTGARSGPLVPTRVEGTVIPHPELGSYELADFDDDWIDVAVVDMSDFQGDYLDGMAYHGPTEPALRNRIQACRAPAGGACPGVPDGMEAKCEEYALNSATWYTRHINAVDSTDVRYKCVKRYPAPAGIHVPGAARWRWAEDLDEVLWFRCDQGCCDEQG